MTEIVSIELKDGNLEIIKRKESDKMLLSYPPRKGPDKVWKEVYGAVDGKVELIDLIKGKHTPNETIPETFNFD